MVLYTQPVQIEEQPGEIASELLIVFPPDIR